MGAGPLSPEQDAVPQDGALRVALCGVAQCDIVTLTRALAESV